MVKTTCNISSLRQKKGRHIHNWCTFKRQGLMGYITLDFCFAASFMPPQWSTKSLYSFFVLEDSGLRRILLCLGRDLKLLSCFMPGFSNSCGQRLNTFFNLCFLCIKTQNFTSPRSLPTGTSALRLCYSPAQYVPTVERIDV